MFLLCCPAISDYTIRDIVFVLYKGRSLKKGFGVGSRQTGELAGIFYCFLWQRTTSSSSVCAASQVCCSRPQISVLKHMRQTALGNSRRPLQSLLIAFWFFPSLMMFIWIIPNAFSYYNTWKQILFVCCTFTWLELASITWREIKIKCSCIPKLYVAHEYLNIQMFSSTHM